MQLTRPKFVALEVTTRCNLKCVMCPHGIGAVEDPRDASTALVRELWLAMEHAETIHLNGVGEPLLARPFWSIVDRLKGRTGPRIDFNTNGLLLNDQNLDRLALAPLGAILVSFDAASEEVYARIRGGAFSKVVDGTRRSVQKLTGRADIKMTFVVMRENIHEMIAFVDLAAELGVNSVWFGTLTEPAISSDNWVVRRSSGWEFRYKDQKIDRDSPLLRDAMLAAVERGRSRNVAVEGADMWGWSHAAPW